VTLRLTTQAEQDIAVILRQTKRLFGPEQVLKYAGIIENALAMIAEAPSRPSSQDRSNIRNAVRSLHLELAAKRRGGASHIIYYTETADGKIVILRLLHEAMDPRRRLIRALRGGKRDAQS
jgi:toxin ParE1/3/4